jgi:hypothetical protein
VVEGNKRQKDVPHLFYDLARNKSQMIPETRVIRDSRVQPFSWAQLDFKNPNSPVMPTRIVNKTLIMS